MPPGKASARRPVNLAGLAIALDLHEDVATETHPDPTTAAPRTAGSCRHFRDGGQDKVATARQDARWRPVACRSHCQVDPGPCRPGGGPPLTGAGQRSVATDKGWRPWACAANPGSVRQGRPRTGPTATDPPSPGRPCSPPTSWPAGSQHGTAGQRDRAHGQLAADYIDAAGRGRRDDWPLPNRSSRRGTSAFPPTAS